jgi:hypothetical protein
MGSGSNRRDQPSDEQNHNGQKESRISCGTTQRPDGICRDTAFDSASDARRTPHVGFGDAVASSEGSEGCGVDLPSREDDNARARASRITLQRRAARCPRTCVTGTRQDAIDLPVLPQRCQRGLRIGKRIERTVKSGRYTLATNVSTIAMFFRRSSGRS